MEHEMRKQINKFKDFLKENSEEKLNISDVSDSLDVGVYVVFYLGISKLIRTFVKKLHIHLVIFSFLFCFTLLKYRL